MDLIIKLFTGYLVGVTAGVTLEVPRNLLNKNGISGLLGYGVYLILLDRMPKQIATFLACSFITLLAHFLARRYKAPVSLFIIPPFFIFVPGSSIYQTALHFIQGETATSAKFFVETLTLAGSIALGVFVIDSFLESFFYIQKRYFNR